MKTLLCTLFATLVAVTAIQATPAHAAKLTQKQRAACEKAKKAGNYDTPIGRAVAKVRCNPNRDFHSTYWKEHSRQQECVRRTGRVCK